MDRIKVHSDKFLPPFSNDAMDDLHRVAARLDALEVHLSVLSIQMQHDTCRFEQRTEQPTRELSEVNKLLRSIPVVGN